MNSDAKSNRKLNIVLIGLTHPYRGGIALYTTLLVQELMKKHQVSLINFKRLYPHLLFPGRTQYDESQTVFHVDNRRLLDSMWPPSWWKTAREISRREPDLVIFQWWQPFLALASATIVRILKKKRFRSSFCAIMWKPMSRPALMPG